MSEPDTPSSAAVLILLADVAPGGTVYRYRDGSGGVMATNYPGGTGIPTAGFSEPRPKGAALVYIDDGTTRGWIGANKVGNVRPIPAPPPVPVANFTYTATNLAVQFSDVSTGAPTAWAWAFGDGATSAVQSPSHTYAAGGTYAVTLTASNATGASPASQMVTVVAPVPIPPPPTRPFPAPTTTRTVTLPPSIDTTGVTDMAAALNAFLASVPNGSVIDFGTAGSILLSQGIQLAGRSNIALQLRTCRLVMAPGTPAGTQYYYSPICLGHAYGGFWTGTNTDIAIYGGVMVGTNPKPGVWPSGGEAQHSIALVGSTRVEVSGLSGTGAYGDFLFVETVTDGWVHDCHGLDAGRNGVSVISGNRITVERTPLDKSGYVTFDIEPNVGQGAGCTFITWQNGSGKCGSDAFFALDGSNAGVPISDITVSGITTDALDTIAGFTGTALTRPQRVTFVGNAASGAANNGLKFQHIDGLTVKGNTGAGVALVPSVTDCTGVVTS